MGPVLDLGMEMGQDLEVHIGQDLGMEICQDPRIEIGSDLGVQIGQVQVPPLQ